MKILINLLKDRQEAEQEAETPEGWGWYPQAQEPTPEDLYDAHIDREIDLRREDGEL